MFSKAGMLNSLLQQIRKKMVTFFQKILYLTISLLFLIVFLKRRHRYLDLSNKILKYFPENDLEDIIDNISEVNCRLLWFWNDTLINYIPIKYSDRMFSYLVSF